MERNPKKRRMTMRRILATLGAAILVLGIGAAGTAATLDDIEKKGEFVVGVRDGAIPFGFFDANNEHVGFSVDMAKEFHKALEEKFGKSIRLTLKTINPKTRIPLVANRTLHMVAGSSTHTVAREETVDFTITVFLTGTQLLAKKAQGLESYKDLAGKRVGAAQGSTNEKAIRDLNEKGDIDPPAEIVVYQEHSQGMLALQKDIIDAYCTDGILLAGLKAKAPNPDEYELVGDLITYDPYAYIVPEDDSKFRDFINIQLIAMIKDGRYQEHYDKWFGPQGTVPYPMTQEAQTLMKLQAWP
jgi:polar amino acid transport system substrate-binding protein/glutamate/aspartate transport system substrate-binding protein